jgi:hypothetical protein
MSITPFLFWVNAIFGRDNPFSIVIFLFSARKPFRAGALVWLPARRRMPDGRLWRRETGTAAEWECVPVERDAVIIGEGSTLFGGGFAGFDGFV